MRYQPITLADIRMTKPRKAERAVPIAKPERRFVGAGTQDPGCKRHGYVVCEECDAKTKERLSVKRANEILDRSFGDGGTGSGPPPVVTVKEVRDRIVGMWRPVADAPKDKALLLWFGGGGAVVGFWAAPSDGGAATWVYENDDKNIACVSVTHFAEIDSPQKVGT